MTSATPFPNPPESGPQLRQFGKYFILRKLAEGGMAQLFLAKHLGAEGFERDVVLKLMLDSLARSKTSVEMFLSEARLAARLSHPNIVQITDLGQLDGTYFICMEYLAGEDLNDVLDRLRELGKQLPFDVVAKIGLAVAEGLEFAHGFSDGGRPLGIVHRDVNPSNILVTYQGTVKIVDFGIAKAESNAVNTSQGELKGKWMYMAPEQARGEVLDGRADVFALGLTLFELLTGKRVFERDGELAILSAILDDPIPKLSSLRPDVPPALEAIVMKALERDLRKRYAGAAALRADLEAFLARTPSSVSVGRYLNVLVGAERVAQRTRIPTLKELKAGGQVPAATPSAPEKNRGTMPAGPRAMANAEPAVGLATPQPATPSRMGGIFLGALGAVALLAAGGGLMAYFRPSAVTPPTPVVEAPAPVAPTPPPAPAPVPPPTPPPTPPPVVAAPAPAPAPAPVRASPPEKVPTGPLTAKEISAVISKSNKNIYGCFERHRTTLSGSGKVVVKVTIELTGAVSGAAVETAEVTGTPLGDCLSKQVKLLKFRKIPAAMSINLPFAYRTQE